MNTISSIIATLSSEEKRSFISTLKQKNKRNDTKNIQLFKLLDPINDNRKDLDIQLYGKRAKGAFHALCKRLHDNLIDFIATKSFDSETSEEMEILKLLLASRIFFEQKQYKIAIKTIRKATLKAKTYDLFSILHEIYYTKIQYSHVDPDTSLDHLIKDFRNNQKLLQQEENLNLFYANIQDKLSQNRSNIAQTISDSLDNFDLSITNDLTFRSLFKILEIINQAANAARNFHSILSFVEETYQQIESKEQFTDKHLFYHIQILYYVANSYFRNKNFVTSQEYLKRMEQQMTKQRGKYYKRFLPQLELLKALNYNYTGQAEKAILSLENFDFNKIKDQTSYILDLKLTLIVFYFQQSRCKEALKLLNELHHSDTWYTEKAGIIWVIKKNLTEILLHIELDHIDIVESRVKGFRKKHRNYLKNNNEDRVLEFLSLTMSFYLHSDTINTKEFLAKIKDSLSRNNPEQEDIFTMSFYAWLKAWVLKSDLYQTTLEVVTQSNKD
ncbi:hypothetical protein D1818_18740 [Aquimarina sp. BL5]|uniref:hypothetical protein n=1 Tax=Aquimarina sp. BL5 TaxID=1714860 RepID=UPI000E494D9E|nr:hypothetical protein [Aquimarina sp. BL5]AXT52762.1 hypothetical protein D1818_18740 [Aquimarina sp. BL5]RKN09901.1 hypothetical protein D7036_03775 [Aquimarina sp. BL5]